MGQAYDYNGPIAREPMEIKNIIKDDKDRVFIVDMECFILFTGEEKEDIRPFIRIGTWRDMPTRLIPMIGNIIVTDPFMGDPANEQFNIDLKNLKNNSYLGKEIILKDFLMLQENFELYLANSVSMNIEKNMPRLEKNANAETDGHFTGIFYKEGNVHIGHSNSTFFDLHKMRQNCISFRERNDILGALAAKAKRYKGGGFIIWEESAIFYNRGQLTSYNFPEDYFTSFSELAIDPDTIENLILPLKGIGNISPLLKLKEQRESKLNIFSNAPMKIAKITQCYPEASIIHKTFDSMKIHNPNGLRLESFKNSSNMKLSFSIDSGKHRIKILFLNSTEKFPKNIFKDIDAILLPYTLYEESTMLLKSMEVPLFIIDDKNPNLVKLNDLKSILIFRNIQYELRVKESCDDIINENITDREFISALNKQDSGTIIRKIKAAQEDGNYVGLYNFISALRGTLMVTSNRIFAKELQEILLVNSNILDLNKIIGENHSIIAKIYMSPKIAMMFLVKLPQNNNGQILSDYRRDKENFGNNALEREKLLLQRMTEDRKRLDTLLDILYSGMDLETRDNMLDQVKLIREKILERKAMVNKKNFMLSMGNEVINEKLKTDGRIQTPETEHSSQGTNFNPRNPPLKTKKLSIARSKIIFLLVFGAILVSIISLFLIPEQEEDSPTPQAPELAEPKAPTEKNTDKFELTQKERSELKTYGIEITHGDIYKYANDLAQKNGYGDLGNSNGEKRDPHWIYPSNTLIMLDGTRVRVKKGDTLWKISKVKLEKISIKCGSLLEKIDLKAGMEESNSMLLQEARKYAYTENLKKRLKKIMAKIKK